MKPKIKNNTSQSIPISSPKEEIDRLRRTEAFSAGQNQVLELLAGDASLESVLDHLIRNIEDQTSGMICSVLLFDPVTKCLHYGAAPNLPEAYNNAVDGIKIGEGAGSCGTAAHRGELVIVEDIESDPLWVDYREFALKFNLHACWSQPILSSDGSLLGTFAMYYSRPRKPEKLELELIDMAANLAAIAIERKQAEKEIYSANVELKKTLENLRKAQYQLVESEKKASWGELMAGIAHEVNTPLGIGVTAASLLRDRTKEFNGLFQCNTMKKSDLITFLDTASKSSEIILINLQRASELIRSFKQIAIDQSSEEKRIVKVNAYLHDILRSLRPKIKNTKHIFGIECPEGLEFDSYPGALAQIITNLIINSISHGYEKNDEGHIIIKVTRDNNHLFLNYSDDGKGIDNEILEHIFDPFFTTTRAHGGSGLGLHLVYNLVSRKLKGTIKCKSEPGKGTTFSITLPIKVDDKGTG